MKALTTHFDNNNNCIAEQESENIVTVFSDKYDKIWKLNSQHYYIYRIYCNPLQNQSNPYNIFIGKAKDLVGYKVDKMHSQTHKGCLYDIIEIAKLPIIPNKHPMEVVKILQDYIPNISNNHNIEIVTRRMRNEIRNKVFNNNTIYGWIKTIQFKLKIKELSSSKIYPADINENPLRQTYCDQLYDIIIQSNDEEITGKIVGIIYKSYSIPLNHIQEFIENTEKLTSVVNEIKSQIQF